MSVAAPEARPAPASTAQPPLETTCGRLLITAVEAVPFRLPLRRDFKWASLQKELGGFVLVRIHTDAGLVGYGEATPLPDWGGEFGRRGGETQRSVVAVIDEVLAPALIGRNALDIPQAVAAMDRVLIGNSYAKCALDIALHDLLGKAFNVPLYRLLGGAARNAVPVSHMIGLMPEPDALDEGCRAVADGLSALQVKGGVDAERDIRLVGALRRELGEGVVLRLDANQGYRDVKQARQVIAALADAGADYVEQPVEGRARMAEVRSAVKLPIIADESCWNAADALEVVAQGAADCLSIYLAKAGGIMGASRVAAIAAAAGLPCDVNGSIESGIGTAANLHFALAHAAVELACVISINAPAGTHPFKVGGRYYEDDVIAQPLPVTGGALGPLDAPGLGIVVDEHKLDRFRCA